MKPIIVYGNTSLCKMIYHEATEMEHFSIAGFSVEKAYLLGRESLLSLPLLAFETIEELYPPSNYDMLVAFTGYKNRGREREDKYIQAKQKGFTLRNFLSSKSDIMPDITWGDNNIVLGLSHMGVSGIIGCNNLIRQQVYLGHDFKMGSHNQVTAGCTIGGECEIKDYCYLGLGSTIISGIELAEGTLVGAGSTVIKSTVPYSKNVGNPSRVIGFRRADTD